MGKPIRKRKRWTWTAMLALLCLGYVVYTFVNQERKLSEMHHETESLRAREATLKAENERLKQEQNLLQSDAYIEKVAREDLGLVKPGETPYIMGQQVRPNR